MPGIPSFQFGRTIPRMPPTCAASARMIDRRYFVRMLAVALTGVPLRAKTANTAAVRHIGFLASGAPLSAASLETMYGAPLRELGWMEGKNLHIERRYAGDSRELLESMASELVRLNVELIIADGTDATLAAKNATSTIPIVIRGSADPVRSGVVSSLAKPGGNVTGYSTLGTAELEKKRIGLLREVLPGVQRIARLDSAISPYYRLVRQEFEQAYRSVGVEPIFVEVAAPRELEGAFAQMRREGAQALVVGGDTMIWDNRARIMDAAVQHALPTAVGSSDFLEAGGLVSYNISLTELRRRGASFIDRILRGAKPADLPIEQPTQFELGINVKTAKALGITVPQSLISRADHVIQ